VVPAAREPLRFSEDRPDRAAAVCGSIARVEVPRPALVVLVGASAAGKSTWAAQRFASGEIVSSDALRGMVGEAPDDLAASADAFAVQQSIVEARLRRGLTAVVDSLGLERERRRAWAALAERHGLPAVAVVFETPAEVVRARNRTLARPVRADVLDSQLRRARSAPQELDEEGFAVIRVAADTTPAAAAPPAPATAPQAAGGGLRFGLHLSRFDWEGGASQLAGRLRRIGAEAAEVGFESLWVMDHLRQIPQVGRAWEDLPESFTTLGYLAACAPDVRVGALVAGINLRNVALLGKIVATLDVLSGGRAVCGLGTGWFAAEQRAYGFAFPPLAERYELLADALELLPLLWGPGAPSFSGRRIAVPEATCYPRPLQPRIPIIVGGDGERRTLRLVAERADGCSLFGDPDTVRRKLGVLARHCRAAGRDPAAIEVTHLSTALAAPSRDAVAALAARLRPGRTPPSRYAASVNAATAEEHVARFAGLHQAGVQTAIVRLADVGRDEGAIERFAPVIAAFRGRA
jgi:alkanesulfonate monooxygenase SsuD/methylene tetrahydromethanopterin reductase-like flavin-dependent oxidoreductase (luciferase family)/predicted kinase